MALGCVSYNKSGLFTGNDFQKVSIKRRGFFGHLSFMLLLMIGLFPVSPTVYAQTDIISDSQSLELRVASLEQKYDSQIIQVLGNYFDRQKFFVDVTISADLVNETYSTTQNQITRENPQEVMMPGLPFLPEENLKTRSIGTPTTERIVNENKVRILRLNNLRVRIYADSSFTHAETEFMVLIAGIAAKVNEARGDLVTVSKLKMPDFSFRPTLEVKQPEVEGVMATLEQYIPGFVLLLLVGLTLLVNRFTRKPEPDYGRLEQRNNLRDSLYKEKLESPVLSTISYQKDPGNALADLDILTNLFFRHPKEVALLFEYWMEEDQENGVTKAAEVALAVDKNILKSLKNELSEDSYQKIASEADRLPPHSIEKKKEVARNFNALLNKGTGDHSSQRKHHQLDLFNFLGHINAKQVAQLLEGEDRISTALVMDYLPDDKAVQVFDILGQNRTADIMVGLTKLNTLSYEQHKEVSSRLFNKTMDLIDRYREQSSGADNILPILEKLPLDEQRKYIEQLKAMGNPVGELIQSRFITVDQISRLEDQLVRDALSTMDTGTLLAAVIDLDEKSVNKLLASRPKREQRLIQMEIEQGAPISKKQSEEALNNVMKLLRQASNKRNSG
jgi:flagellar motor switch protein FliG